MPRRSGNVTETESSHRAATNSSAITNGLRLHRASTATRRKAGAIFANRNPEASTVSADRVRTSASPDLLRMPRPTSARSAVTATNLATSRVWRRPRAGSVMTKGVGPRPAADNSRTIRRLRRGMVVATPGRHKHRGTTNRQFQSQLLVRQPG